MRRVQPIVLGLALLVTACQGAERDSRAGSDTGPPDSGALEPDERGYAVHGDDLYPPLLRRVVAVACPDRPGAQCRTDDACGPNAACFCEWTGAYCVFAECRTDDDCAAQPCLLSYLPSQPKGAMGLYCGRRDSLCSSGGDCPGNGTACAFNAAMDRFECSAP